MHVNTLRSALRFLQYALFLLLMNTGISCQKSNPEPAQQITHVYVKLEGVTQQIKSTRVSWSVNDIRDQRSPYTFTKNLSYFGFDLTSPDNAGKLAISIDGLDDVCIVMSGERQLQIAGEQYIEATILLSNQATTCPISVEIVGIGKGTVRSIPAGIDCPGTCEGKFSIGTKVQLVPTPAVPASPFNWSGDCNGNGNCEIVADKLRKLRIDFTPRICSVSGWCQENPYPVVDTLYGGWIDSANQAYIVGNNGTMLRSVGDVWTSQNSRTGNSLQGIWGIADDDVWAVGATGTIIHWDGSFWKPVVSNTMENLTSIWGSSSNQVWAVGSAGTILKWDGTSWTNLMLGFPSRYLYKIWGSGASDVWVVGESGTIYNWNGNSWVLKASNTTRNLFDVWGTASDNIWAMGYTSIRRYNGSSWNTIALTDPLLRGLDRIWGSSVNTVWASGSDTNFYAGIWRWDGANWNNAYRGSSLSIIRGVFGDKLGKAYAVGDAGYIVRYDGTRWSQISDGDISPGKLYGGWGSDAANVWAVGGGFANDKGYIFRNVSGKWVKESYETPKRLTAAWGSAADDVWAVGIGGKIIRWNGQNWTTIDSGVTADLADVSGVSTNNVWAVGAGGIVLHWDGTTWSNAGNLTDDLKSIFTSGSDVWIVGLNRIHHWNGSAWSASPAMAAVRVHGLDSSTLFAVGDYLAYKWDGAQWIATAITTRLNAITVVSGTDIWASGQSLWHFDGNKWLEADPAVRPVNHIFAAGNQDLFAVGDGGAILHYRR